MPPSSASLIPHASTYSSNCCSTCVQVWLCQMLGPLFTLVNTDATSAKCTGRCVPVDPVDEHNCMGLAVAMNQISRYRYVVYPCETSPQSPREGHPLDEQSVCGLMMFEPPHLRSPPSLSRATSPCQPAAPPSAGCELSVDQKCSRQYRHRFMCKLTGRNWSRMFPERTLGGSSPRPTNMCGLMLLQIEWPHLNN